MSNVVYIGDRLYRERTVDGTIAESDVSYRQLLLYGNFQWCFFSPYDTSGWPFGRGGAVVSLKVTFETHDTVSLRLAGDAWET